MGYEYRFTKGEERPLMIGGYANNYYFYYLTEDDSMHDADCFYIYIGTDRGMNIITVGLTLQ